jgi:hypothetical protein
LPKSSPMNTNVLKPANFNDTKKALQTYQLDRLKKTYSDFSNEPQFTQMTSFFYEQIYGPQDFGFRNDSIKNLIKKSHHFLKKEIIEAVEKVIELNDLSDELDDLLALQMAKINIDGTINPETYTAAYKKCNNYQQRCYQISLMVDATTRIFKLSHIWFIGASLTTLHSFTELLGIGKIMDFLYDGFQAFSKVDDITPFVEAVHQRETDLNESFFGRS